jgi:hypothetical protein
VTYSVAGKVTRMPTHVSTTQYLLTALAIAQAVSRWLPTTAAWVRSPIRSRGICGGQSGTVAGVLQVLWFPLPILIPLTASHSSSSRAGTIHLIAATVSSGLSLTPPQELKKNTNSAWPKPSYTQLKTGCHWQAVRKWNKSATCEEAA